MLVGVPTLVLLLIGVYTVACWTKIAKKPKYDEPTFNQSERIYRDFEFFVKVFIGLVAGVGYVKLKHSASDPVIARQAMQGLGTLGMLTMTTLVIFVATHQASKIRRWKQVEWDTVPFWQEVWMIFAMYLMAAGLWVVTFKW